MLDYYDVEADLDQEERMILEMAREFIQEEVKPEIGDWYQEDHFPIELVPEMGELGFYGANMDGYGLPNISETAYGLLNQELEAGDSGIRSFSSVQGGLVMYPIHRWGSEDQKEEWIPKLASGEEIGCFGLTEPEHGSDPGGMETTAEPNGDEYVLEGSKTWITNSPISDVAIVWARDVGDEDRPVRGFIVETDRDGVTTNKQGDKLSMRASSTGEIGLTNVHVPEENMLPEARGLKAPLSCLSQARYTIAWGAVGVARDCFETARDYALEREQFDKPIASFQLQQEKLTEMATQITTAQLLVHRLAELKERGDVTAAQISMAKRNNVRMAREQAKVAREMLGGNGVTADYAPMRHLANIESVYTYEGTHDIHSLIVGEDLTDIQAYR
jgi:alkylation response protein AidB-like acyl-CoA dehydrogenase